MGRVPPERRCLLQQVAVHLRATGPSAASQSILKIPTRHSERSAAKSKNQPPKAHRHIHGPSPLKKARPSERRRFLQQVAVHLRATGPSAASQSILKKRTVILSGLPPVTTPSATPPHAPPVSPCDGPPSASRPARSQTYSAPPPYTSSRTCSSRPTPRTPRQSYGPYPPAD